MAAVVGIAEFLEKVAKQRHTQSKIDMLKYNDCLPLRIVLQGLFDPNVVWLLPPGDVPYTPCDLPDQEHVLHKEAQKIRYFVKGFYDDLPQLKREMMFIELLEKVTPADAKMLLSIKDKKNPFKGLTVDHVKEGLPGLIVE